MHVQTNSSTNHSKNNLNSVMWWTKQTRGKSRSRVRPVLAISDAFCAFDFLTSSWNTFVRFLRVFQFFRFFCAPRKQIMRYRLRRSVLSPLKFRLPSQCFCWKKKLNTFCAVIITQLVSLIILTAFNIWPDLFCCLFIWFVSHLNDSK